MQRKDLMVRLGNNITIKKKKEMEIWGGKLRMKEIKRRKQFKNERRGKNTKTE